MAILIIGNKHNHSVQGVKKESVPYPFLASFINKRSGGVHYGKRIAFQDKEKLKEGYYQQFKQLKNDEEKKKHIKEEKKRKEFEEMLQLKEDAIRDDIEREIDLKTKQDEFKREMTQVAEQKRLKSEQEKFIRHNEIYDYFPYTHGESIDNMKESYKKIILSSVKHRSYSTNKNLASQKKSNKSNVQSLLTRTGLHNPLGNQYLLNDDKEKKFRTKDDNNEVFQSALKRFESTLQTEEQKKQEEQEYKDQIEHNLQYEQMLKEKLENEKKQIRQTLLTQINENKAKSKIEDQEK